MTPIQRFKSTTAAIAILIGAMGLCMAESPRNFFTGEFSGSRTDFSGQVGYEFEARASFAVTALGRSTNGKALEHPHTVTLWSVKDQRELASVLVTPESATDAQGFAYEVLPEAVQLDQASLYRITSSESRNGDPIFDLGTVAPHLALARVTSGVFSQKDGFPATAYGQHRQGYGVPAFFVAEAGLDPELLAIVTPDSPLPDPMKSATRPLLREMQTGYLLDWNFRSIRAYMWKKRPFLTGWETDDRGGSWESSPEGFLPIAFDIDWFKLVDSSEVHPVRIQHQIARQDCGRITLEYRFRLPERMDGASWQLRDMEQSGLRILAKGNELFVQEADGGLQSLQTYEPNVEYGVKVVADIDQRQADIFIDGRKRASGVPFLNGVKTLDYVRIQTGGEATGDLFLGTVKIHKGYDLCETFVTATAGSLPEEWEASRSGKATVETLNSMGMPDIYSLKLEKGSVTRSFEGLDGKFVFKFRFMAPVRTDAAVELMQGSRPVGSFVTEGEHLSMIDPQGRSVRLVKDYRANFWYDIQAVVDPASGEADISINGKPPLAARCGMPSARPDGLRVVKKGGTSPLWLDDFQLFVWQDYPVDYVPEPEPVNQLDDYLVGVQSCSLWREGNAYAGWDYVYPYADHRKPYLGWYDEGNPEVADWEIKWQVEHGIDFEQYCWYRPDSGINNPIKEGVLEHGLRKGLFNARYGQLKKFTIMYTNQGYIQTNPEDWEKHLIPYWIEYYFKDPRYLKVDGKPVFSIYHYKKLLDDMGGAKGAADAIEVLRQACTDAGFPGLIVLMEDRSGDQGRLSAFAGFGVDYCWAYTWGWKSAELQMKSMESQREAGISAHLGVIPNVSMGWETRPWGGPRGGFLPVDEYQALLQWTKDSYMPSLPEGSLGRKMLMLANWNEFGEGHFLMPSNLAGFGYVDAIREVFPAPAGDAPNLVPTEAQKKRFTLLYPKD